MTRTRTVLLGLGAAHVVLAAALFPFVAHTGALGDETAYLDGGRALSNLVRDLAALRPPDGGELRRDAVGSGWFMPGMSVVLTPLFLLVPHASILVVRAYLGVLSTALLLVVARRVQVRLGAPYAGVLLVVPGLVPTWVAFGFSAYGDLWAGLVIVLLLLEVLHLTRLVRAGVVPGWRDGVRVGLLAIATVYLRSSATVVVAGLLGALGLAVLWRLRGASARRGLVAVAVAAGTFVVLLLPWSVAASETLGARVMTTTSVPTVLANTFGDRAQVCYGPCDPGSTIWFDPLRYSREVGRATGLSEVEVQRGMSSYARRDVTPHSYSRDVLSNLRRYVQHPARFSRYLGIDGAARPVLGVITDAMFFGALAAATVALLMVVRGGVEQQLLSIGFKLGLGALLTQPFVHLCGTRYWTCAAPLLGLGLGLLWGVLRRREPLSGDRVLTLAQGVLSGLTLLISAVVLCLAA